MLIFLPAKYEAFTVPIDLSTFVGCLSSLALLDVLVSDGEGGAVSYCFDLHFLTRKDREHHSPP